MNVPRVISKKAFEYVGTFEPSLTVESLSLRSSSRTIIEKSVDNLGYDQQAIFYQDVLAGLQILQETVTSEKVVHEPALDAIEFQILTIQNLLSKSNHQPVTTNPPRGLRANVIKSLEEKQQIARSHIEFLGGCNLQCLPIMSPKEYKNLIGYVNYLVEHEQVPPSIERIRPTNISKDHIKHTFYLIHKQLCGTNSFRDVIINFLIAVFQDFETKPTFSTMKTKFSVGPKSYYADVEKFKKL